MNLRVSNSFYLSLLKSFMEGKDIPYLVHCLAEKIQHPVLLTNSFDRILAFHEPFGTGVKLGEYFPVAANRAVCGNGDIFQIDEKLYRGFYQEQENSILYQYLPLQVSGKFLGNCIVLNDTDLDGDALQSLWETLLVILLVLKSSQSYQEEQEQYQDEFIRDVLYNNYDSKAAIMEKARQWNWDLTGELALIVCEIEKNNLQAARESSLKYLSGKKRHPVYSILNDQLIMIVPLPDTEKSKNKKYLCPLVENFLMLLQQEKFGKVNAGMGTFADSVSKLHKIYQEAKVALELGKSFSLASPVFFDEMGVLRFVFSQPARELEDFSQQTLGGLLEYDQEMETDLRQTLTVYIELGGQIADCAKALYVHENTLRNRLKRIEQLTGYDLRRIDHLVNIFIALQVLNLGGF